MLSARAVSFLVKSDLLYLGVNIPAAGKNALAREQQKWPFLSESFLPPEFPDFVKIVSSCGGVLSYILGEI